MSSSSKGLDMGFSIARSTIPHPFGENRKRPINCPCISSLTLEDVFNQFALEVNNNAQGRG